MRNLGLMVTPGNGYRTIVVDDSMTIAQLVTQENLFGRTLSADGTKISPDDFATTTLRDISEIWATGAVKGA